MIMANRKTADVFPLGGKRIGFMGKGGAGKSTVSVLLAKELARRGYEVCLLDADSTNLGLHRALGLHEGPRPLIEHFGGMVFSGGEVTCPVDDPTLLAGRSLSLHEMDRKFVQRTSDGISLLSGGKMGELGPGAGCDGPIAKIARDVEVRGDPGRLVTLVDLKAGMEDLARGVITNLDWAIAVVDPSLAAIKMAESLGDVVSQIRSGVPPATAHLDDQSQVETALGLFSEARVKGVLVVLNRSTDVTGEVHLAEKLSKKARFELVGALREDLVIGRAWFDGSSVSSPENEGRMRAIADRIETAERDFSKPVPTETTEAVPAGQRV